jgi:nucleoside-diphosphate-sugar epimerase
VRALVTGGAGFIGSSLCEYLLKKNFKVIVIDNLKSGNINNLKNIEKNIVFIKVDISFNPVVLESKDSILLSKSPSIPLISFLNCSKISDIYLLLGCV